MTSSSASSSVTSDFATLALPPHVLANLTQLGYLSMTPIQAASLPPALLGKDIIAQAKTGSGKTAAFALALLANLNVRHFAVQAMVLCPTRELADQVTTEIRRLARAEENIKVVTLCGGVPLRGQTLSLEHGAHIVVGTPGRVMDHLERQHLSLEALNTLVLDEADRMLDMGFFDDIATVARQCPKDRQTLLFSATYPEGIAKLSAQFMKTPVQITVQAQGFSALALFGELEQRERDEVLVQFANKSCSVLVATDVAARGLDIADLSAVINVDVTPDSEVHIHRIGRTGRGDAEGLALNLVSMDEMGSVGKIEQLQGRASQFFPVDELTPAAGGELLPPRMTIQIIGGRKEKIRAGDVMGAMCADFGYSRDQIGKISVNDFSTYVAVDRKIASAACARLNAGKVKGKTVKARLL